MMFIKMKQFFILNLVSVMVFNYLKINVYLVIVERKDRHYMLLQPKIYLTNWLIDRKPLLKHGN